MSGLKKKQLQNLAVLVATVLIQIIIWKIWLFYFTKNKICTFDAQRVHAKANIGKYLPGNVMHYVE